MSKDKNGEKFCKFRGCKVHVKRGKWCSPHRREVRKEQLRVNNIAWQERIQKGKAEHYLWYNDRPTDYALSSETRLEKAIKHARELHPDWTLQHIHRLVSEAKKSRGAEVKAERSEKKVAAAPKKAPKAQPKKAAKKAPKKTAMEKVVENGKKAAHPKPKVVNGVHKVEVSPEEIDHSPKAGTFEAAQA